MIRWQTGRVRQRIAERAGMQEVGVELDNGLVERALHDTTVHEPLREGDVVLLNTTAVRLGLGTGGYHFVHAVLAESEQSGNRDLGNEEFNREPSRKQEVVTEKSKGEQSGTRPNKSGDSSRYGRFPYGHLPEGHLMKLKYTSLQRAVLAAEEKNSPYHEVFRKQRSIAGVPVLIGELHSMLPVAAAWLRHRRPDLRVAYVMTDGGALPLAFSRHAAALKQLSWLCGTVTYGQAYGGDLETMNKFTALIAARHVLQADVIIVCMGPGIAGTGTPLGHTGTEAGELVNAVYMLGGIPVMMGRVSEADVRPRHYGLSHHLLGNLQLTAACPAVLPLCSHIPEALTSVIEEQLQPIYEADRHQVVWLEEPSQDRLSAALEAYPLNVATMGRTIQDDPGYYLCIASAAEYALRYLDRSASHSE